MSFLVQPTYSTTTSTNQSQSAGTSYGTSGGSSSTSANFSPDMQELIKKLLGYSQNSMSDPTKQFAPVRDAALQGINRTYADVPGQVASQLARRGYGSSGSMGDSQYKVALARGGAISDLEGQLATKGIDQQNYGSQLATQLLGLTKGTTSTSDSTYNGGTTQIGSSTGTETKPGPSILSSVLGGLGSLGGLLLGLPTAGGGSLGGNWLSDKLGGGGSAAPDPYHYGGSNPVGTATTGF